MAPLIDYSLIAEAVKYYTTMQFRQVEVPWLVSSRACFSTLPVENVHAAMLVEDTQQYLVGSAEQGFLEINLPQGRWLSVSPCFRNDVVDQWHQTTFMKVELHQTNDTSDRALREMIAMARTFFEYLCPKLTVEVVPTNDGWDIEIEGIEVGSYGRRDVDGRVWLYGTGVALPRLSQVRGG